MIVSNASSTTRILRADHVLLIEPLGHEGYTLALYRVSNGDVQGWFGYARLSKLDGFR